MLKFFLIFCATITTACFAQPTVSTEAPKVKIGLCIVATGKYDSFVKPLIESARTHFCPNQEVTFFIFTDGNVPKGKDIVEVYQKRIGWPYDTLKRFHVYDAHRDLLQKMDYLFACDADMLFVGPVGEEILSDRVATIHGGFIGQVGTYETRRISTAYVEKKIRHSSTYFAGAFYGGTTKEFFKLLTIIKGRVDKDIEHDVMALWHDESHLNRYFNDFKPTKVLPTSYCYLEILNLPYEKKLLALHKPTADKLRQ